VSTPITILLIAFHFVKNMGVRRGGRVAMRSAWQALRALCYPTSELSYQRTRACWNCKMYDSQHETCGNPVEFFEDEYGVVQPLGCHCIVHIANRLPEKRCWAREHDVEDTGWDDELMPP